MATVARPNEVVSPSDLLSSSAFPHGLHGLYCVLLAHSITKRPVSPPNTNNDNFNIKLPKMSEGPSFKKENNIVDLDDDIISLHDLPQLPVKSKLNNNGHNNLNDVLSNRRGLQISRAGGALPLAK